MVEWTYEGKETLEIYGKPKTGDVERALTLRRYPVAGTLTFEVLDELCPWNRG
ncbi:unnamed protein product, partial [marine sediment metagenome]